MLDKKNYNSEFHNTGIPNSKHPRQIKERCGYTITYNRNGKDYFI